MNSRLKEMTSVLKKYKITQGLTPEKLRLILQELGPTYIKLGQIMSLHSDILPKEYCEELMKLCSDVEPMPFEQVEEVLYESFGCKWNEIFSRIDKKPLGAASIAQVHYAVLKNGDEVVVKVQRKGIHDIMSRDITMLHKAVRLVPPVPIKGIVDFDMVLDEMWAVAQEEMNFLTEASNMEEFARNNKDIVFAATPCLYREYTTSCVLVMEYIDGYRIDDKENLQKDGYDLNEIGSKLVDNYIKQVIEDGFFHADPHPGNVHIRDGKIVWMDMGMMGRLSERDKKEIGKAVTGIALNDIGMIQDAVLAVGDFRGEPDTARLYKDIRMLIDKYGNQEMGQIDVAVFMQELMEIMKTNKIALPHGFTMLARGLTQMEGVLADIAPSINMVEIAAARLKEQMWQNFDWKSELKNTGKTLYKSAHRAITLPQQLAHIIEEYERGQTRINLDMHSSDQLSGLLHRLVRNIVMGLWVMALLISSSIVCTTDMKPRILGIPALGVLGYLFAVIIVLYTIVKHFISRK
ncbi:MAG: AarF/UbiB family protein [Lachnospiraceae bacterium]|nr:AarF/UbiB family protein [uncultured Agathobacter sp.]MDD6139580.1 AarF/UbiB family protein [Lachnospiraceae bacterium]